MNDPKIETVLTHTGRNPEFFSGTVSAPVHRSSTILFPTLQSYIEANRGEAFYPAQIGLPGQDYSYATTGTPSHFELQKALGELDGGHCLLTPSGLSAITLSLLAFLKTGDHVLLADSVYGPTRRFCDSMLKNLGIEAEYYPPLIGADIAKFLRAETKVVFTESPGSLTFEVQDIPAIVAAAHANSSIVIMDNSWATPIYFQPLKFGVDIAIQAGTKYIGGHSDVLLGVISTNDSHVQRLVNAQRNLGVCVSPDECFLASRGLRSLAVRLNQHQKSAMTIAKWLEARPEVEKVFYPALPSHPQHDLWKRDFSGASGLFSFSLRKNYPLEKIAKMLEPMRYFGIGSSWGGFESLLIPVVPNLTRSATNWNEAGNTLRLYAGLENVDDLIADLAEGFTRLNAA
jgi:cystathionine beta-lyase